MDSDNRLTVRIYTRLSPALSKAFKDTCNQNADCPSLILRYAILQYIAKFGSKHTKRQLVALDEDIKEMLGNAGLSVD